jgi:putative SbcD/Mre11-related phosphoesterase
MPGLHLGRGLWAHPSRALWVPDLRAAFLADLHLGYAWALRRRGQLGPTADSITPSRLDAVVDELQPAQLVLLGDIVHAPRPGPSERQFIEETLLGLARRVHLVLILGNHDRGFLRDFHHLNLETARSWQTPNLLAVHGDRPASPLPDQTLICGHHHPAVTFHDAAGVPQRIPVFAVSQRAVVLPALSPYAAGLDLRRHRPHSALQSVLGPGPVRWIAASGSLLAEIPFKYPLTKK